MVGIDDTLGNGNREVDVVFKAPAFFGLRRQVALEDDISAL